MSTFENPFPQPNSDPNVDLYIPQLVDDEWCADFNSEHGMRGKRAIVNARSIMRNAAPLYRCRSISARDFKTFDLVDAPDKGVLLDGEVISARMVSIWDEEAWDYTPVLHLAMRDVVGVEDDSQVASPLDEVWVPLTNNDDKLHLY